MGMERKLTEKNKNFSEVSCHKRTAFISGLDAEEGKLQSCFPPGISSGFLPKSAQNVNVSKAREHLKKQHFSITKFTAVVLKIKNYQPSILQM